MIKRNKNPLPLLLLSILFCCSELLNAEVVFDGSLGQNPSGTLRDGNFTIAEADGALRGDNLFHSFSRFNVNTGESANFSHHTQSVQNIIARVTGDSVSNIDGALASDASLWLMNPNGLVFGQEASLNINGSFHATTADYLGFDEGERFYADLGQDSLLSVAEPKAFGFLGSDNGNIVLLDSRLIGQEGESLSLVGGHIGFIESTLVAPSASRINLASAASSGEVSIGIEGLRNSSTDKGTIGLENSRVLTRGDIAGDIFIVGGELIARNSDIGGVVDNGQLGDKVGSIVVDVDHISLSDTQIASFSVGSSAGSNIAIHSNAINLWNESIITAEALDVGKGGSVAIKAEKILLDGTTAIVARTSGNGDGGELTIQARDISLSNGSLIAANTVSIGKGGSVTIEAEKLSIDGFRTQIGALTLGEGGGGNVAIQSKNIELSNGGRISATTFDSGQGGSISIDAENLFIDGSGALTGIVAETQGMGEGGNITIQVKKAKLLNRGLISMVALHLGQGGSISIDAEKLFIDGSDTGIVAGTVREGGGGNVAIHSKNIELSSSGRISTTTFDSGQGGSISIDAEKLFIDGSGALTGIAVDTDGEGDGGNIAIQSESIELSNGGLIDATTSASGQGGSISIDAEKLSIDGLGASTGIAVNTSGEGDGGNIAIQSESIELSNGGLIDATTSASGQGGSIKIDTEKLFIDGSRTGIAAQTGGKGDGGEIVIQSRNIELSNNGLISTTTFDSGQGGSIMIEADELSIDGSTGTVADTGISAQAFGEGDGGEIVIQSWSIELSNGGFIDATTFESGQGGSITIEAEGLSINGSGAAIAAQTSGKGDGGNVAIQSRDIELSNGGLISAAAAGSGQGGSIRIESEDLFLDDLGTGISAQAFGEGEGGEIVIQSRNIQLSNGSFISANTLDSGQGGSITVDAKDLSVIDDASILAKTSALGNAGSISLNIDNGITLKNQAQVSTTTESSGNAGNITIQAGSTLLDEGSSISSSSAGVGKPGMITVSTRGDIQLNNQSFIRTESIDNFTKTRSDAISLSATNILLDASEISTRATGKADAGNININTQETIQLFNNSAITTASAQGGGGNIRLITRDLFRLQNSEVVTSVAEGAGNGGNIFIDPEFIVLEDSLIQANADAGNGGNITLIANYLFRDLASRIEASSNLGINGSINIRVSSVDNLENYDLSEVILDQSQFLQRRCGIDAVNNSLTFSGQALGVEPIGHYLSSFIVRPQHNSQLASPPPDTLDIALSHINTRQFESTCSRMQEGLI